MLAFNGARHCTRHPQVKLVFSGFNRALNATRFLCPLCGTVREYSSGVIKHINNARGFFFIENGCGRDFFAHIRDLAVTFFPSPGQAVEFEVGHSPKGLKALAVRPL
jgi:cold shock CspA family protein